MEAKNNASAGAPGRDFVITRSFEAPRQRVFSALTEYEHLRHWWGPKGFTWVGGTLDLRPGGLFHYCMRSPDGREMWGKFVYREIVHPERLVFVNSFSDKSGATIRAPFAATWPLQVLNTITLAEEGGRTILTLNGAPLDASDEERRTFDAARPSMQQGFTGTFDQLADYLATGAASAGNR
jgi:uncharacterized protein YndB with AHSA1/START domain